MRVAGSRAGITAIAFEVVRDATGSLSAARTHVGHRGAHGHRRRHAHPGPCSPEGARAGRGLRGQAQPPRRRARSGAEVPRAATRDGDCRRPMRATRACEADLVVGAVFTAGERTPKLLPRSLVGAHEAGRDDRRHLDRGRRRRGDLAPDLPRQSDLCRGRRHPLRGAEHAVRAASRRGRAISAAVLPYVRTLAGKGIASALRDDAGLRAASSSGKVP